MGFFSKIKENFNHGGIDIQIQNAPHEISINATNMPIQVNISATDSARNIEYVKLRVLAVETFSGGEASSASSSQETILAETGTNEPFVLAPGETKVLPFMLSMGSTPLLDKMPDQISGLLNKFGSVQNSLDNNKFSYYMEAQAKVEGIAMLGPVNRESIKILNTGESNIGLSVGINL